MPLVRTKPQIPIPGTSDLRQIVESIRSIFRLRLDAAGEVTLTINVATTTVTDIRVGVNSVVVLQPMAAVSATEQGNGTIYVSSVANGSFVITHANNATAGRIFRYIVMG